MRLLSNPGIRRIVCGLAIVLGQAYQLARARLAGLGSPTLDRLLQRDHLHTRAELLERELAIHRVQRSTVKPHKRPTYGPEQRWAILQLMWLRNLERSDDRRSVRPSPQYNSFLAQGHRVRLIRPAPWQRSLEPDRRRSTSCRSSAAKPVSRTRVRATHNRQPPTPGRHPDQPAVRAADTPGEEAKAAQATLGASSGAGCRTQSPAQAASCKPSLARRSDHGPDSVAPLFRRRSARWSHTEVATSQGLPGDTDHQRHD